MITGGNTRSIRFWPHADGTPAETPVNAAIAAWVEHVRDTQPYRRDLDVLHMCLYGNDPTLGGATLSALQQPNVTSPPLTYNVVRSVVETLASRMVKAKPKPWAQTSGASWRLQREAKKLTKYTEGGFSEQRFYRQRRQVITSASVLGTGGVKVYFEDGSARIERVFMPELLVSDDEAKYGDPRTKVQARTIGRAEAVEEFGGNDQELRDLISNARPAREDGIYSFNNLRDQIDIYEGWHLPSANGAEDGRHVIAFENCVILDEPLTLRGRDGRPRFPIATIRYSKPLTGWYGIGLARLLMGKQLEISKLLFEIQRSFHLGSNFRIFAERGSKIIKSHFNNEIGAILEYTGAPPIVGVAQTVHPEKFQHLLWLIQSSFAEAGINAMSAAGQKDPTLKSGRAQEVAMDVEDSRYADFCQEDEDFVLDVAELMVETAREAGKDSIVMYTGGRHLEKLSLSAIDLKRDEYVLAMFPTSALASTPAARMEQVQGLLNGGMVTNVRDARRLLGFPDLEDTDELDQAAYDITRQWIEDIIDEGKYHEPIPMMDLDLTFELATNAYLYVCTLDDIPPRHRELLLQFITAVGFLKKQGAGSAPQLPPGNQPAPPAPPPQGAPAGAMLQ